MVWIYVILHVLFHTDSSFITWKAAGFGNLFSLILTVFISSAMLIALSNGNKRGIKYFAQHSRRLGRIQFRMAIYLNSAGKFIEDKFGLKIFKNGTKDKVQKRINIISYGLVDRLGYLGLIILNLIPVIPFAKEAGLIGGQLLGLENVLPVALFFNGLRIVLIFKIFF
jgi:hypothetical protein